MGTSTSSTGPKGGSALDPPWLNDIQPPAGVGTSNSDEGAPAMAGATGEAPPGRYRNARLELRRYIETGDTGRLAKALGHYSSRGSGGAAAVASRMRVTTKAGANLFSMLSAAANRSTPSISLWVDALRNRGASSDDVANAIVYELSLPGGSVDEESMRDSMAVALSDLMQANPDIDLLSLGQDDIWALMGLFLATAVVKQVCFDIGQALERSNVDPVTAVQREQEMREFIKSEVNVSLRNLRAANPNPSRTEMERLMRAAIETTFQVFEVLL
jgi:hypothetical protein